MSATGKKQSSDGLQAENQLLLAQLHRVQEELEHYYLQNKQLNEQLSLLESRLKQLQNLPVPKLTLLQKCTDRLGYTSHQDIAEIRNSGYMDIAWYLEQNHDVKESGIDAVEHYYKYGWKEGRSPGPGFNSEAYLKSYSDVASANIEPLLHYLRYGKDEGRSCFGDVALDSNSALLIKIEQLRFERSSINTQLHQLEQTNHKLQSQNQSLQESHRHLEERYQRENAEWRKAESTYQNQVTQQTDTNVQKDAMIEQLQQQLERATLLHEQALEQHHLDRISWENTEKQNQANASKNEEAVKKTQLRVLELQAELTQLNVRYEQAKELRCVEREAWEKAEVTYKEQLRQQADASTQQSMVVTQLQQQLERATLLHEQALEQHRLDRAAWDSAEKKNQVHAMQQGELVEKLQSYISQLQTHIGSKFDSLLDEQKNQFSLSQKTLHNTFEKSINNAAKQIESFIGVQNYLKDGVIPFDFHGWPISPDIALFLLNKIESNNYDLIIEFGSGTSTALFAEALIKKNQRLTPQQSQLQLKNNESNSQAIQVYYEPSSSDLPRRIVTFEHNKKYYDQTHDRLVKMNLDHAVDLVYAPLVDYQFKDGSQYLYYHCSDKLQELARVLKGRKANILLLVDGPPGATNKNARFPALPQLLMALPEHSFTIVMDDYFRAEEREIVELWKKILEERSLTYRVEEVKCEKGCAVITIGN